MEKGLWVTDFIRYHVLIRVFHGDIDSWIRTADRKDLTFLRWLKERLTNDASLLPRITDAVNGSGLWPGERWHFDDDSHSFPDPPWATRQH